jgi:hypothetical protein
MRPAEPSFTKYGRGIFNDEEFSKEFSTKVNWVLAMNQSIHENMKCELDAVHGK